MLESASLNKRKSKRTRFGFGKSHQESTIFAFVQLKRGVFQKKKVTDLAVLILSKAIQILGKTKSHGTIFFQREHKKSEREGVRLLFIQQLLRVANALLKWTKTL
jgi:hypothetical protein